MNQVSKENESTEEPKNNMHDIILFVIFGIFVLLVLESFYKLASKILKSKYGLNINLA